MAVDGTVTLGHAGHVVHACAPSAAPIGSVAPGAVQAEPFVVGAEGGENLMQPFGIAKLVVIDHLRPGHQVGPCAYRVVALEAVSTIGLDLAADETVRVLLGVEVVECALEGEEAGAVAGKHQDEGGVPHEDVAVVSRIEVARHESRARLWRADVAYGYLPCLPVHLQLLGMSLPDGVGEYLTCLVVALWLDGFGTCHAELVLRDERFLHVGVFVGQTILLVVAAGLCLQGEAYCQQEQQSYGFQGILHLHSLVHRCCYLGCKYRNNPLIIHPVVACESSCRCPYSHKCR